MACLAATSLAFLVWLAIRTPVARGDSGEYLLTIQALASHGTPDIRAQDASRLGGLASTYGMDGVFGGLREGIATAPNGSRYSIHFWMYPLTAVPVTYALRFAGMNELAAPQVTNGIWLLCAMWLILAARSLPFETRAFWAALTVLSPALWFCVWPHPEVFTFALVTIALAAASGGRWLTAAAALSFASTQNQPLLLLAITAAVVATRNTVGGGRLRALVTAGFALVPCALPPLFYLRTFGRASLIYGPSASLENVSWSKALDLFFDLNVGLLVYAPLVVSLSLVSALMARTWPDAVRTAGPWIGAIVAALAASTGTLWNTATSGPSRYAVWLYPFVAYAALGTASRRWGRVAMATAVAAQLGVIAARLPTWAEEDHYEHSWAAKQVLDRWPHLYEPDGQVWMARTSPTHPGGPHVFRGADGHCRKAYAQKRHARELEQVCGPLPPRFQAWAAQVSQSNQRDRWTYVTFEQADSGT
jgi:hypothetical protein